MYNRATFNVGSVLLACLLLCSVTASAQRFKWWQDEGVKRKVGLTDEQVRKIDDLFMGSMPDLTKSKQELDRLETDLISFVDSTSDDAALRHRIDRVEAARAELNKKRSLMLFRMRRILTVDQRVKLEAVQRERDRDRPRDKTTHPR